MANSVSQDGEPAVALCSTSTIDATSADMVFAVPELLENILIYVGAPQTISKNWTSIFRIRQVFVMQRTCTLFRDMIRTSRQLRRIMFLESKHDEDGVRESVNPYCYAASRHVFYPIWIHTPSLKKGFWKIVVEIIKAEDPERHMTEWKESPLAKGGSWRQMLITNDSLKVKINPARYYKQDPFLELKPRTTFGELIDILAGAKGGSDRLSGFLDLV